MQHFTLKAHFRFQQIQTQRIFTQPYQGFGFMYTEFDVITGLETFTLFHCIVNQYLQVEQNSFLNKF